MTAPNELTELRREMAATHRVPRGLEAYFPPCTNPACERRGRHADVLEHQAEFISAPEKYLALLGGYGAGKTLPAAVLGAMLSRQIRGNRGFVGRRTYSKLHDSTLPIYLEVMKRVGIEFDAREVRDGWPHRVILPNGSEIVFRETKDLGRFLGPEYGWFHLDEAAEEPKKTFTDLQGRLRLPHAARFLKGFITSNPPHHTHWIPEIFGSVPGVTTRGISQYRLMQVATSVNPFLPASYIADLRANNSASEVRRILEGQYGFAFEGEAVYMPPFDFGRHVAALIPATGITVIRSWDFGYRTPAVTWHQMAQTAGVCSIMHWWWLDEYTGANLESETLAGIVLSQSRTSFSDHASSQFLDCGDRSGAQMGEKGPGPIMRLAKKPYGLRFRHRNIPNIDPGLALLRDALRGDCACGRPVFQIDRTCRHSIDMLAGGYHYPQARHGHAAPMNDKPKKDGFYDNLADSGRYAGENVYRGALRDPEILERLLATQGPAPLPHDVPGSWDWLEQLSDVASLRQDTEYNRIVRETTGA